jgi:hypothetical protein
VHKVTNYGVKYKENGDFFSKYHNHGMQILCLWDCGSGIFAVPLHPEILKMKDETLNIKH